MAELVSAAVPSPQETLDFRWSFLFIDPDRWLTDDEYWSGQSTSEHSWQPKLGSEMLKVAQGWTRQMV